MMQLGKPPDEIRHERSSQVYNSRGKRPNQGDFSGARGRVGGLGKGRMSGVVVLKDAVREGEPPLEALDGEEGDEEADCWGGGIWWGKRRGRGRGAADYFGHFCG